METRQLRYFVKVYEERHLSRAAELCNVSQSAVSFHVAKLEGEIGGPLFVRDPRGMHPTAAGELLYRHALPILRGLAAAGDDLRHAQGSLSGDVAIGIAYSAIKAIGRPLMQTMLSDHPQVRLSLTESIPGSTLLHMMKTEFDLALTFNPPPHRELVRTPILQEPLACIGRPDIIGASSDPIGIDEMLALPLIMFRRLGALVDETSLLRQIDARARLRMNSVQAIGDALVVGHGAFIGSRLYARELLESGAVHLRPIASPPLYRTLYLVELADRPATFLLETMRRLLRRLVADVVNEGGWEAKLVDAA